MATELVIVGAERDLPPGIELAAFRIVHEALTNVLEHAGQAASATVSLSYDPHAVVIEVIDTGRGAVSSRSEAGSASSPLRRDRSDDEGRPQRPQRPPAGASLGMADPNELVDLVVERQEGITATFADGHVASFGLEELRCVCPCATCRSLRDRGEDSWPRPSSPMPLSITDARFHGGWGLNVTWNDDHSTGIYPFEALRRLSDAKPPPSTD